MSQRFSPRLKTVMLIGALLAPIFNVPLQRPAGAQVRAVYDNGAAGLGQLLRRLQTTASAMHVAAHPDDEDSAVIARLARGDGARVAYLSLTRGEGGQNIIGRELFDALGVIRTEELLQARRLDGGDQFFTRAIDFGFTKTRAETAEKWGEQAVLEDMVRAIRLYRPLVIFSRFSGTDSDGHGQHQMAGYLAPLAFRAAADPAQFPQQIKEGLRPWRARKFYVGRFGAVADANAVEVRTGERDQLLGRTYFQIAIEGRSQHKSQEMGRVELNGPQSSVLRLVETNAPPAEGRGQSLFDGLDTSITGLAALAALNDQAFTNELKLIGQSAAAARERYQPFAPQEIIAPLTEGLEHTRRARRLLQQSPEKSDAAFEADFLLARKEAEFIEAIKLAAGVVVDVLSDAETVAPGESLAVRTQIFVPPGAPVRVGEIKLKAPAGWAVEALKNLPPSQPAGRFSFRETPTADAVFDVKVPPQAPLTAPYWLREKRDGYLFHWPADAPRTAAVDDALLTGSVLMEIGGAQIAVEQPVEYRFGDRIRGELRRNLNVTPAVTLALDPARLVVPLEKTAGGQRIAVRIASNSQQPVAGTLELQVPPGLTAAPAAMPFSLAAKGERATMIFNLTVTAKTSVGNYQLRAVARAADGRTFNLSERTIAYPHIQTHRYYQECASEVQVMDLKVAPVSVGYIMGSGDDVPAAIKQMGLAVTMIDENELSGGDLAKFDTIVVGVRASEVRPDLVSNNKRLLDYVQQGGTLIVQYQQYDYVERGLAPFPAKMAARVTDETAVVRILEPAHPVFNFPNKITGEDWQNWVQERSLYNFASYDARYQPLLEAHDPGENAQTGGQVYARLGRGHYVYTSYAWFRQLPAGVPGAFRLFANLLSLSKAPATKSDKSELKSAG